MTREDMIHMEDWEKLDLRAGKIVEVDDHPNADKLYVLTVDFGPDIGDRTIVAGLKQYCTPEHLKGKTAIFILNLEPATIRGIKSEGMILATISHHKSKACILRPDDPEIEPGSKVS
jgi:methionyl-tRNA synthetase